MEPSMCVQGRRRSPRRGGPSAEHASVAGPGTPVDVSADALRARIAAALRRDAGRSACRTGCAPPCWCCSSTGTACPRWSSPRRRRTCRTTRGSSRFPGGVVRSSGRLRGRGGAPRGAGGDRPRDRRPSRSWGSFHDVPTTVTNFVITPGAGRSPDRADASTRTAARSSACIEIPLAHLLEPTSFREEEWEREGVKRAVLFVSYGEDVVWGTTGRILREVLDALFPELRVRPGRTLGDLRDAPRRTRGTGWAPSRSTGRRRATP